MAVARGSGLHAVERYASRNSQELAQAQDRPVFTVTVVLRAEPHVGDPRRALHHLLRHFLKAALRVHALKCTTYSIERQP